MLHAFFCVCSTEIGNALASFSLLEGVGDGKDENEEYLLRALAVLKNAKGNEVCILE